jgi:hypothetical protein
MALDAPPALPARSSFSIWRQLIQTREKAAQTSDSVIMMEA